MQQLSPLEVLNFFFATVHVFQKSKTWEVLVRGQEWQSTPKYTFHRRKTHQLQQAHESVNISTLSSIYALLALR